MIIALTVIAYHEAAHALTALHFGFEVETVDITGNETHSGETIICVPAYNPSCDHSAGKKYLTTIFNDAVVDFAGNAATEKFLNEPTEDFWLSTDYRVAHEKIIFYVAAKSGIISHCDYSLCYNNRLTKELYDDLMLETHWKRVKGTKQFNRAMESVEKRAQDMIEQHWRSIRLIAEGLLKNDIMYGSEIRVILAEKGISLPRDRR
jgi:hypothetical protein